MEKNQENREKYYFITEHNLHTLVAGIEPAELKNPLDKGNSKIHHLTMEEVKSTGILNKFDQMSENFHNSSEWSTNDINTLNEFLKKRAEPIQVRALNINQTTGLLETSNNPSEVPERIAFASMQELYDAKEWDIDNVILKENATLAAIKTGLNYELTYYTSVNPNGRKSSEYISKPSSDLEAANIAYERLNRTNYLDSTADLVPAKLEKNPRGDLQFMPDKGDSLKDMQKAQYQQVLAQGGFGFE